MRTWQKRTKSLRPGIDESKSRWIRFPIGEELLLPVVARHQKLVPVFQEDGGVEIKVEHPDAALQPLVDKFFELVATVDSGAITIASPQIYADFLGLVRRLLKSNYDMTDAEIVSLLTLDNRQVVELFNSILRHLVEQ